MPPFDAVVAVRVVAVELGIEALAEAALRDLPAMRVAGEHPLPGELKQLARVGGIVVEADDRQRRVHAVPRRVRIYVPRPLIVETNDGDGRTAVDGLDVRRLVAEHDQAAILKTFLQVICAT